MSRRSFVGRTLSFAAAAPFVGIWSDAHRRELGVLASEWKEKLTPKQGPHWEEGKVVGSSRPSPRRDPEFTAEARSYASMIGGLGLRHIRPHELIHAHQRRRGTVSNSLPPEELWDQIIPTLRVADELRERLGVPLRVITSAYRSPEYNSMCPGAASHSQHTRNRALDLIFDAPPERVFSVARRMRDEGFFRGGLGLYPGFVHVDTRGHNATW